MGYLLRYLPFDYFVLRNHQNMRIAFLADPLDRQYGGIHVYTKELLLALSKVNYNHEYIIIRPKSKNEFPGMEEIVVPYVSFPGYRLWRSLVQLPQLLTRKGVDIVVEPAHFGPFNLPKHIKRVTVIHDMTVFLYPQYHVFLSQFLQRKILPRIVRKSDHIITNSSHTTKDLIKYFPSVQDKTTSILLGKDKIFSPHIDHDVLLRNKVSQPYILFVGTLEPRKNISTIIKAFELFKTQTGKQHQLVLIGKKGWKSADIFDAIAQSPFRKEIIWLGFVAKNELPIFYSMAEIFVYPSFYEGFGLPVLEAMACGTPVITSEVSSLPEVGGSAVLYTNPNSVTQLAQLIKNFSTDPALRKKYSLLGLKQASKFSWKNTALETNNIFKTMA